jgi:hypothetical protein
MFSYLNMISLDIYTYLDYIRLTLSFLCNKTQTVNHKLSIGLIEGHSKFCTDCDSLNKHYHPNIDLVNILMNVIQVNMLLCLR